MKNRKTILPMTALFMAALFLLQCSLDRIDSGSDCSPTVFTKSIGGTKYDDANDVIALDDCSFVVCGITQSFSTSASDYQGYLVKVDANGIQQWERNFGSPKYDYFNGVAVTRDGGFTICGGTNGNSTGNYNEVLLVKANADGIETWSRVIPDPGFSSWAVSVKADADGSYTMAVNRYDTLNSGKGQIGILRVDANGNKVFLKVLTSSESLSVSKMVAAPGGGYFVIGTAYDPVNFNKTYVAKIDQSGNKSWEKTFISPGSNFSPGYDVASLSDGSFAVAASILGSNDHDFNVIRYNNQSPPTLTWQKPFGGPSADEATSIEIADDGNIVVAGYTSSFSSGNQVYLLKLNASDGNTLWERNFGEASAKVHLAKAGDGGFILATGEYVAGDSNIRLYKTDKDGNQ